VRRRGLYVICAVIAIRFVLAGLFWLAFRRESRGWCLAIVALAFWTDVLDGQLSRKHLVSAIGGYLDAVADFFFVMVAFSCFWAAGIYAWWVLALIAVMFVQFVATSGLKRPTYDPVGKYFGVYLYLSAGLTVLGQQRYIYIIVAAGLLCLTLATVTSRIIHLCKRRRAGNNPQ